jgi:hypothetical protein
MKRRPLCAALLCAALAWLPARSALAEEPVPLLPPGASLRGEPLHPRPTERGASFARPGRTVDASEALDELIDELAADLARLGLGKLSPVLLERVRLSDNLSPTFAATLEARLAAALSRAASAAVLRCAECWATRARIEDANWVVSRGLSRRDEVQRVAAQYGARAFLSASLSVQPEAGTMAMDVELVRADDAAIVFAETYRFHADDALLYRGADRAQSRAARLKELEDRVASRPTWGHGAYLGVMRVPSDGPDGDVIGPYGFYQLSEYFGADRAWRFGLRLGGFLDSKQLAGGLIEASLAVQLTSPNVWAPAVRVGVHGGGFLTGQGGNTSVFGGELEVQFGTRLTAFAQGGYMAKLQIQGKGPAYGGFVQQIGVAFLWN